MKKLQLLLALLLILGTVGCANANTTAMQASGQIEAKEIAVAPELSGRVVEVSVNEGDSVKAGDPLLAEVTVTNTGKLEGDEVVHEDDLPKIQEAMCRHLDNPQVEALYFDYIHFQGNQNTYVWDPGTYRTAPRILRNTIPAWAPKGLFFIVLDTQKTGRYPRAAHSGASIFHYGWVRSEAQMNLKKGDIYKHWQSTPPPPFDYAQVDAATARREQAEIAYVRAVQGAFRDAHDALVAQARLVYEVPLEQPYDVVIAQVDPPKDVNIYQASRAATYVGLSATPPLRPTGIIIVVARCPEGAGQGRGERRFFTALSQASDLQQLLAQYRRDGCQAGDQICEASIFSSVG